MVLWCKRRTKRSPTLPCPYFGINPSFAEEIIRDRRKRFTKPSKGRQNHLLRLGKGQLLFFSIDWGIDIGVLEFLQPQQSCFQAEIFLRQRIVTFNRLHHRFHSLWLDL